MASASTLQSTASAAAPQFELSPGHCAVVGLQWGDEGKGKIVDLLTARYDYVVRYNGGANAGHTVVVGDQRFALHLVPSGILYPDKVNVLGNGVVIDPEQLLKEIDQLRERGVRVAGANLRISDRAHIVLPYHKLQDQLQERAIARARGDDQKIGTTGRGIGPAYADKALRSTAIRAGELLHPELLRDKLLAIVPLKNLLLEALARSLGEEFQPIDAQALAQQFAQYGQRLAEHVCDATFLLHDAMDRGEQLLFEGANATLLDIDHGTFPFVTSSNCSSLGASTGTGVPGQRIRHVIGIVKAYQTRVGGGPMPTELTDATGHLIRERGREYGTTTGRPRRCGWLDAVTLRYSARVTGATGLALMLFDVLAGFDRLKVCVAYDIDGRRVERFPSDGAMLDRARPIYEELPGFTQDITACRTLADLPPAARAYVDFVERQVGVPIKAISVGPRRDQTLTR